MQINSQKAGYSLGFWTDCTLKSPSVSLSIRMPHELWEKIAQFVDNGPAKDLSSAVRTLIEGGFKLIEIKNEIDDPDRAQELAKQWDSKMNENDILEWTKNLSDQQMKAVQGAIEFENEQRYKH